MNRPGLLEALAGRWDASGRAIRTPERDRVDRAVARGITAWRAPR
jgi:hypothetical protein